MKSVLYKDMDHCLICGRPYPETHHIFFGTANRKLSDKYGYVMPLCWEHHRGSQGVHKDANLANVYKRDAQAHFEANIGDRTEFIRIFGKNYI